MRLLGDIKDLGYVRRTRDLVELYYGARMVVDLVETKTVSPITGGTPFQLLALDPRRIKWDLSLIGVAATTQIQIGSQKAVLAGQGTVYGAATNVTVQIVRDWRVDFDSVTRELWCITTSTSLALTTREVFLVPPPVDELA